LPLSFSHPARTAKICFSLAVAVCSSVFAASPALVDRPPTPRARFSFSIQKLLAFTAAQTKVFTQSSSFAGLIRSTCFFLLAFYLCLPLRAVFAVRFFFSVALSLYLRLMHMAFSPVCVGHWSVCRFFFWHRPDHPIDFQLKSTPLVTGADALCWIARFISNEGWTPCSPSG